MASAGIGSESVGVSCTHRGTVHAMQGLHSGVGDLASVAMGTVHCKVHLCVLRGEYMVVGVKVQGAM